MSTFRMVVSVAMMDVCVANMMSVQTITGRPTSEARYLFWGAVAINVLALLKVIASVLAALRAPRPPGGQP